MTEITIKKDGPYHIKGAVSLRDEEGNPIEAGDQIWLCRCGLSAKKPFCDGAHKRQGFSDAS